VVRLGCVGLRGIFSLGWCCFYLFVFFLLRVLFSSLVVCFACLCFHLGFSMSLDVREYENIFRKFLIFYVHSGSFFYLASIKVECQL